jgi:hypothetical protein
VNRPKKLPDIADREALVRIAELAGNVLVSLRQDDRGRYDSERGLGKFLTADGVQYTTADIGPALTLLEVTGRLGRAAVKHGNPQPGWLPEAAPETAEDAAATTAEALIHALQRAMAGRVSEIVMSSHSDFPMTAWTCNPRPWMLHWSGWRRGRIPGIGPAAIQRYGSARTRPVCHPLSPW